MVASLTKSFKKKGIYIDRMGLQSHFISGSSPSYDQQVANMAQFTSLGVEVAITELDVRVDLPDNAAGRSRPQTMQTQSKRARILRSVWVLPCGISMTRLARCRVFAGQGDADPWWGNFTKKPAYCSVAKVLGG